MQYNCSVQKRCSRTADATDTMSACVHSTRTSSSGCTATCCALGPSSCPASGVGCSSCAPEHATHQLRTRNSLQHACFENLFVAKQPETSISSPLSSCEQHLLPASEQPKILPLINMHAKGSTKYQYHCMHENKFAHRVIVVAFAQQLYNVPAVSALVSNLSGTALHRHNSLKIPSRQSAQTLLVQGPPLLRGSECSVRQHLAVHLPRSCAAAGILHFDTHELDACMYRWVPSASRATKNDLRDYVVVTCQTCDPSPRRPHPSAHSHLTPASAESPRVPSRSCS